MGSQEWFYVNLGFDRNVLRNCKKKFEFEVTSIHPRQVLRDIRKKIESIKDSNENYLLDIIADPIQIDREEFGQSLGIAKGGLIAKHEHYEHNIGNIIFKPYKRLSNIFLFGGAIFTFIMLLYDFKLIFLYILFAYLGIVYGKVRAETTFPMKISDEIYCLMEGELSEDKSHNVDSNISLIIAGVNYCGFWDSNDYRNYFQTNFALEKKHIISKSLPGPLFYFGNIIDSSNHCSQIVDEIDNIKKDILVHIYEKYEDVIQKASPNLVSLIEEKKDEDIIQKASSNLLSLIGERKFNQMTSYELERKLQRYLEFNYDLGKYLNTIILNQEINDTIRTKKNIFKTIPDSSEETDANKIIESIYLSFTEEQKGNL